MTADIEAISFVLVGPADAADQPRVGFENDARLAVFAELVGGGQAGRPAAGDDGLVGRHDATVSGSSTRVQRWGMSPGRNVSATGRSAPMTDSSS